MAVSVCVSIFVPSFQNLDHRWIILSRRPFWTFTSIPKTAEASSLFFTKVETNLTAFLSWCLHWRAAGTDQCWNGKIQIFTTFFTLDFYIFNFQILFFSCIASTPTSTFQIAFPLFSHPFYQNLVFKKKTVVPNKHFQTRFHYSVRAQDIILTSSCITFLGLGSRTHGMTNNFS